MDTADAGENPFVRKLRLGAHLSPDDERLLARLAEPVQRLAPRQDLLVEGDAPHSLPLVLDGWACRYRDLPDGRRQIIAFFLPGDLCEPYCSLPHFMDHSIGALTPLSFVRVPAVAAREAAKISAAIERALDWDVLASGASMHERIVSLGQRTAFERLGHLLCELHLRLMMVGLADRSGFDLPLTQQDLGHALGISAVHVNRSLKAWRDTGFFTVQGRRLQIHDLRGLREASLFDPNYLHLDGSALP